MMRIALIALVVSILGFTWFAGGSVAAPSHEHVIDHRWANSNEVLAWFLHEDLVWVVHADGVLRSFSYDGHQESVSRIPVSFKPGDQVFPRNQSFVVVQQGDSQTKVSLWHVRSRKLELIDETQSGKVIGVSDGNRNSLFMSTDQGVMAIDLCKRGEPRVVWPSIKNTGELCVSRDGKYLARRSLNELEAWDEKGEHLWSRYHEPVSGFFTGIQAVSSDAFIVQTLEDDLKVISFRNGEVLFRKELAWTTTPALAGSSRGRLALVSKERHPLVCDIRKGEECQFERVPEYKSYEVKISDDNNVVAVSSGLDIIRTEKDEKRGWIARWGREDSILFVFRVGQLSPVATIRSHADGTVVHPSEP